MFHFSRARVIRLIINTHTDQYRFWWPSSFLLLLQRSTSSELVSQRNGGGGGGGLLSGLARLVPMGMPRTSLRYKRHLSCADLEGFDRELRGLEFKDKAGKEEELMSPNTRLRRCVSMPVAP